MKNAYEDKIRSLTLAQIDALRVILNSPDQIVSSKQMAEQLEAGSGKSISAITSLARGNDPIIKKVGKLSVRDGYLWEFNNEFAPIDKVRTLVNDIFATLKKSGWLDKIKN